jgi:hypothetical protein
VRLEIIIRIGVALIGTGLLMLLASQSGKWIDRDSPLWGKLLFGGLIGITIVAAIQVIIRGKSEEKVAGIMLCIWPALCLLSWLLLVGLKM